MKLILSVGTTVIIGVLLSVQNPVRMINILEL